MWWICVYVYIYALPGLWLWQGLSADSSGFLQAAPLPSACEAYIAEQEAWAVQSDKKTSEFLAILAARGGQAIGNAGEEQLIIRTRLYTAMCWIAVYQGTATC